MSDLYLTAEELADHTGLTQAAAQRRKLEAAGLRKDVHFFVRADRKIRLLRVALTERATAQKSQARHAPGAPNFDALPSLR